MGRSRTSSREAALFSEGSVHQFGRPTGRRGRAGVCQEGGWLSRAVGQEARPAPRTPLVLHPEDLQGRDSWEPRPLSCSHGPGSRTPALWPPAWLWVQPTQSLCLWLALLPSPPGSRAPHGNCFPQPLRPRGPAPLPAVPSDCSVVLAVFWTLQALSGCTPALGWVLSSESQLPSPPGSAAAASLRTQATISAGVNWEGTVPFLLK